MIVEWKVKYVTVNEYGETAEHELWGIKAESIFGAYLSGTDTLRKIYPRGNDELVTEFHIYEITYKPRYGEGTEVFFG